MIQRYTNKSGLTEYNCYDYYWIQIAFLNWPKMLNIEYIIYSQHIHTGGGKLRMDL